MQLFLYRLQIWINGLQSTQFMRERLLNDDYILHMYNSILKLDYRNFADSFKEIGFISDSFQS